VYCQAREPDVGPGARCGGFEIEHFRPQSRFRKLVNRYGNLAWSCAECNAAKGDAWPSDEERELGYGFPEVDAALGDHLEVLDDLVKPRTRPGEYLVDTVNLNSRLHQRRRERRRTAERRLTTLGNILTARRKNMTAAECSAFEAELNAIRHQLFGDPWDAVERCPCAATPKAR